MVLAIFSCIGNAIIAVMAILVIAQEGVGADAGAVESVQDFLIKLDMKPCMHLVEISIFSLNHVIVRLTKIMNNLLEHLKIRTFKVIFLC